MHPKKTISVENGPKYRIGRLEHLIIKNRASELKSAASLCAFDTVVPVIIPIPIIEAKILIRLIPMILVELNKKNPEIKNGMLRNADIR